MIGSPVPFAVFPLVKPPLVFPLVDPPPVLGLVTSMPKRSHWGLNTVRAKDKKLPTIVHSKVTGKDIHIIR